MQNPPKDQYRAASGSEATKRRVFAIVRVLVGVAIVTAVVGQLMVSLAFWQGKNVQHIGVNVTNFFSFFTIDSNVGAAVLLLIGAILLMTRRGPDPSWYQLLRASLASYMIVTGIVYNLLLRGIELPQGSTLAWSNEILHVIAPLYLLIDWLFAPGRAALRMSAIRTIIVFPLVWASYTLVRGPFVDDEVYRTGYWYPYPFLNPNSSPQGYFSVAFYVVLIAVVIGVVGVGVVWVSNRGARAAASAEH